MKGFRLYTFESFSTSSLFILYWAFGSGILLVSSHCFEILKHFNKGNINVTFLSRSSSNDGYVAGIVVTGLLAVLSIVFAVVICCVPNIGRRISENLSKKGNVPSTFLLFSHRDKIRVNLCYFTGIDVPLLFKSLQRVCFYDYIYHITILFFQACINDA